MSEQLLDSVNSKYGAVTESTLSNDHAGVKAVAEAFGYSADELTSIPAGANMGLSCGNPTATAYLRKGEVVRFAGCSCIGIDRFGGPEALTGQTGTSIPCPLRYSATATPPIGRPPPSNASISGTPQLNRRGACKARGDKAAGMPDASFASIFHFSTAL